MKGDDPGADSNSELEQVMTTDDEEIKAHKRESRADRLRSNNYQQFVNFVLHKRSPRTMCLTLTILASFKFTAL
jgi:hypothetical protein